MVDWKSGAEIAKDAGKDTLLLLLPSHLNLHFSGL